MWDAVLDGVLDSLKLLPFLFITYLVMEYIENRMHDRAEAVMHKAGRLGPLIGGALGLIPQCGFSAAAASLFSGRVITLGTLITVFLVTSDEMLPVMISQAAPIETIVSILLIKLVLGMAAGFVVDLVYRNNPKKPGIHELCENEHCSCEDGIVKAAIKHTLNIFIFILIITVVLDVIIFYVGERNLGAAVVEYPFAGELLAGAVGLIPNCSASVIITQLYLDGIIGTGPLMSGLLVGAGVGLLVLFRTNRNRLKQNVLITVLLYAIGVASGTVIGLTGLVL
ncbi:MAG: arsenic efflux protein [Christensenellaceae bacterium]|nr:arsenic efflux protein [Christensenellaceae bacterium]